MTETLASSEQDQAPDPPTEDEADEAPGPRWSERHRFALAWMIAAAGFCLLGAVSSFGAPLNSVPDEPDHVARAVALDHGQLLGRQAPGPQHVEVLVTVPASLTARGPRCFQLDVDATPRCVPRQPDSSKLVPTRTYEGRAPPTYYAVVGLPSVFSSSPDVVYWMRLLSLIWSSALLGLALALALRFAAGSVLVAGVLVAVTPKVLYDSSVVQPSGLETAAAICAWVALALCLWRRHDGPVARAVVNAAGASCLLLCLSRAISPFWLLAMLGVILIGGSRRAMRHLARRRDVRIWGGAIVAAAAFQVTWDLWAHAFWVVTAPRHKSMSFLEALWASLQHVPLWSVEAVSTFGYATSRAPSGVYIATGLAILAIVGLALWKGTDRQRVALLMVLGGSVAISVVIASMGSGAYVGVWTGRYTLPFAVGIPILASRAIRLGPVASCWFVRCVTAWWAIITATVLWAELRRFSVGDRGPLNLLFTASPAWQPPLTLPVLAATAVAVSVAMVAWIGWIGGGGVRRADRAP